MESESANKLLKKLLVAHNIELVEEGEWLVPFSTLPAIRATWFPNTSEHSGLLQVDVYIDENIILNECFAGLGTDTAGLKDAIGNFSVNSLHVMLSAFWGKHDPEQVEKETWCVDNNEYTVYIGSFGNRGANGEHPGIPDDTFEKIEVEIKNTGLKNKYNWFRTFFCNLGNNKKIYEALYNNETWLEGENSLKALS